MLKDEIRNQKFRTQDPNQTFKSRNPPKRVFHKKYVKEKTLKQQRWVNLSPRKTDFTTASKNIAFCRLKTEISKINIDILESMMLH